jgi:hypothetical protein
VDKAVKLLLFAALALLPPPAAAQPRVEVTARVDRADVTIGDRVRYEITVEFPEGGSVELPAVKGNIGRFELRDYRVSKGRGSVTHVLDLAGFTLGEDTLPPQRVEYRAAGDSTAWVSYAPATFVRVKRITPENAAEIADIDETGRLPGTFPWGLPLLALLALAIWRYRAWRRKNPRRRPGPARPPLTPYEAALEKLGALERSGGRGREFAFALSGVLREYLGLRYGVDALEATTTELVERTAGLPYPAASHAWLKDVSEELDTVKFATGAVTDEEAARWIEGARAFLETTRAETASPEAEAP